MEKKLSAVVITLNEESHLARCLDSLKEVADEIVVVDSFSTDKTEVISNNYGAKFIQHPFEGHIEQKNFALAQATHHYVLSLDADEALSSELKNIILEIKKTFSEKAYSFPRHNFYCGKPVKHGGWYPDIKIRLWDKREGKWGGTNPHDKVVLNPGIKVRHVPHPILHYSVSSVEEHLAQVKKFSDIAAKEAVKKGKTSTLFHVIFSPLFKFIRDYFLKLGFLDGYHGLVISGISAHAKYLKYSKMRALKKNKSRQ